MQKSKPYICVHCGEVAECLYRHFSRDVIQMKHCSRCQKVVDPYVEFDFVLTGLDLLLLKLTAYRHIICNVEIQRLWRFILVFVALESYIDWILTRYHSIQELREDTLLLAAWEARFYILIISKCVQILVYLVLLAFFSCVFFKPSPSSANVVKVVALTSLGRLFIVPALAWNFSDVAVHDALRTLVTCASGIQAYRSLTSCSLTCGVLIMSLTNTIAHLFLVSSGRVAEHLFQNISFV